jgi:predicted RNase H-like HicB family nuclease
MANLQLIVELEEDGRFVVDVPELPGVQARGVTRDSAIAAAEAQALRVLAEKLEAGEKLPVLEGVFTLPVSEEAVERETAYLLSSESMKNRLIEAKNRDTGMNLEEVLARLGV